MNRVSVSSVALEPSAGPATPFDSLRCIQTIYPINGMPMPVAPGSHIDSQPPDMYGRPWARIWEHYFEKGDDPAQGR